MCVGRGVVIEGLGAVALDEAGRVELATMLVSVNARQSLSSMEGVVCVRFGSSEGWVEAGGEA